MQSMISTCFTKISATVTAMQRHACTCVGAKHKTPRAVSSWNVRPFSWLYISCCIVRPVWHEKAE